MFGIVIYKFILVVAYCIYILVKLIPRLHVTWINNYASLHFSSNLGLAYSITTLNIRLAIFDFLG